MTGLALQGGGCLGYGQVLLLAQAEQRWNKSCSDVFDFIGGTSVGCIVGACLAVGIPATQIEQFFTVSAPKIFAGSWLNSIGSLWGSKYSPAQLEIALQAILGTKTLRDCKTNFISTSYDWATDRPVYFKSFEASYETPDFIVLGNDSDIMLWQVCRASSAAQTYFPAFKYDGMTLMDGGNTGDNAPDMLVLCEMLENNSRKDVQLLSIGAGETIWTENPVSMINPSILRAGLATIKIVFSAGEDAQVYKARHLLGNNYYRLSPNLGDGIAIDDAQGCITKIPPAVNALFPAANSSLDVFNKG